MKAKGPRLSRVGAHTFWLGVFNSALCSASYMVGADFGWYHWAAPFCLIGSWALANLTVKDKPDG